MRYLAVPALVSRSWACALGVVAACVAAQASPREAALNVFKYEMRIKKNEWIALNPEAFAKLGLKAEEEAAILLGNHVPLAILPTLWPYSLKGKDAPVEGKDAPPVLDLGIPDRLEDMKDRKGGAFLGQLNRYVGVLLGDPVKNPVHYLEASELDEGGYDALARESCLALGGNLDGWKQAVPRAMAGLKARTRQGCATLEAGLDSFLDGQDAGPRTSAMEALREWRLAPEGEATLREQMTHLQGLLAAAAQEAEASKPPSPESRIRKAPAGDVRPPVPEERKEAAPGAGEPGGTADASGEPPAKRRRTAGSAPEGPALPAPAPEWP